MELSVILPTHNPDPERLRRTLAGLRVQTVPAHRWETLLVNNASTRFPAGAFFADCAPDNLTFLDEPALGLTAARLRGLTAARGGLAVLVDDDNVLDPDYLAQVLAIFAAHPRLGSAGGKSVPEFATTPPEWTREFFPLLALRDLGATEQIVAALRPPGAARNEYPTCAPLGAGMALRRASWQAWLVARHSSNAALSDRRGDALSSGGDNDIVLCALQAGWATGYFPQLRLTHLIPAARLEAGYLARLNRGIQESWMQVLSLNQANPWPPLTRRSATLRKIKGWFTSRAWSSPAARIRWQGACGHFDGRVKT
jgi:glycosyltransferase involved in cell wall biosynthesis